MGSIGSTAPLHPRPSTPPGSVSRAVERLRQGKAVILPVEGTYLIAATHDSPARPKDAAWCATDRAGLEVAVGEMPAAAVRLVRRLTPGPVVLCFPTEPARPAPTGVRAARLTTHPSTLAVLAEVGRPVVGVEIEDGAGGWVATPEEAAAAARRLGVEADSRDLAAPEGRTVATIVEVGSVGDRGDVIRVVRPGAYEERFVRKQLAMNVLFVCTGNTCRSPMAEAIAAALAPRGDGPGKPEGVAMKFVSAGTAAASGSAPSAEAVRVVKDLDIGATLSGHRSRPLSRKLIAESDAIFTMGRSHMHAILELDPEARGKVQLLDPDGQDVPDPVGMPDGVYMETARRIMAMLKRRLKELGS